MEAHDVGANDGCVGESGVKHPATGYVGLKSAEAERMRSDKDGDKHEPDPFRLLILLPSVRLVELELAKSSGSDVVVDDLGPYQQHVSELERIKAEGAPSAVPSWLNRLTGTWILFPVRLSVTVSV
jgi:hypothetical protein